MVFVPLVLLKKLRDVRALMEKEYLPSRELSLALTKLDECEMWMAHATLREGEAPAPEVTE